MQQLEFEIFTCPQCTYPVTFWTLDEMATHHLAHHELAIPGEASNTRLAFESETIGRARTSPYPPSPLTHWHDLRIGGRVNGAA